MGNLIYSPIKLLTNRKIILYLFLAAIMHSCEVNTSPSLIQLIGKTEIEIGSSPINKDILQNRTQNRSSVVSAHGMVCSSQPLATAVGYDILKAGGNAIDAAIAVNAMLGVVEPMMCGVGGDLFAIVWNEKDQKLYGLNASGRSPYDWNLDKAKELGLNKIPDFTPLSWTVPGCVSGWDALLNRFGTMYLADLLKPAILCANEGFPVSPLIANRWKPERDAANINTMEGTYFFSGKGFEYGEIFKNPDLAKTYELLSKHGAADFYTGEIAAKIVRFSIEKGGYFSIQDFEKHCVEWVDPISSSYMGYDIWALPPNTQGLVVLQMLNILENFDISSLEPNSTEFYHLLIEAKKLAFEDRAVYYADTDFADIPINKLLNKNYAKERAKLIKSDKSLDDLHPGNLQNYSETVYLTVADDEGNMISLIQSNYSPWGSHYVVDELGFCLQNRGALFSLDETHINKLEPHKRPFHTIIPGFVTLNNKPLFSFGVTGGSYQPQGQVQILINILNFGMSVQQAGEQPRIWHKRSSQPTGSKIIKGGDITIEPNFPKDVKLELEKKGHLFNDEMRSFGGYQGIWREENPRRYFGGSDPRNDGMSIGY